MPDLRVVIADDHPVYRDGIAAALRNHDGIELAAECDSGDGALARIRELSPDVAVLDHRMPGTPTREVIETIAAESLPTRVLVLSAHTDARDVVGVLEAGAAGYLSKDADRLTIVDAVRRIAEGGTVIGVEVQAAITEHLRTAHAGARAVLSNREHEVLGFIAEGLSSVQIAERLVLSPTTVKTHLGNLYEKLGVSDRAAAVAEGMRRGLIG